MGKHFCWTMVLAAAATAQMLEPGAALPQIKGTTLDEKEVTLPDAAGGKTTLLLFTFTQAAGEKARTWNERVVKDYPHDGKVTSYVVAMVEDVPSLFRGLVRGGIKRGIPPALRRRFITVTKDEKQWKRYTGVKDDRDAYLILLDSTGHVAWTHHGAFEQTVYDALKVKIADLEKNRAQHLNSAVIFSAAPWLRRQPSPASPWPIADTGC